MIFSAQPQAQLNDIAKRRDVLFGYTFKTDAKTMATFSRPVQAWYLTRTVGTAGDSNLELNTGNGGAFPAMRRSPRPAISGAR